MNDGTPSFKYVIILNLDVVVNIQKWLRVSSTQNKKGRLFHFDGGVDKRK